MSPAERAGILLWRLYAHVYDGLLDVHAYRRMLDEVCAAADVEGRRVVDLGTGTGNVAHALLAAGAAHVTGVDLTPAMLSRARTKLAGPVRDGRVTLLEADAVAALASLPDASADRVTAVNVIYALPDRAALFREVRRVLAPGGFLVASHTTRPGAGPIIRDQYRAGGPAAVARPRLLAIAVVDALIDALAARGPFAFVGTDVLRAEAAGAGLLRTTALGRTYGGPDDGVNELLAIGVT